MFYFLVLMLTQKAILFATGHGVFCHLQLVNEIIGITIILGLLIIRLQIRNHESDLIVQCVICWNV